jgi:hypothetical protein
MKKYPGMVIPSKIKKYEWTYTYRTGGLENPKVVVAEEEDSSQIFTSCALAKTAMRNACGLKKKFY